MYKQSMPTETLHPVLINLPKSLHRKIKLRAGRNLRSVHAEIVVAITNHVAGAAPADTAQTAAAPSIEIEKA